MRIVLVIIAALLTVISLILIAICIDGMVQYAGQRMGNEAKGFQSFFTVLAILFSAATALIWNYIIRKKQGN